MRLHHYECEIRLSRPREAVFPFFANARNLQAITPPWLDFEILTTGDIEMRAGALIDYRLRLRRIPLRWRTQITLWEPPARFVDVQVRGPYRLWEHEHLFEPAPHGTVCRDRVRYAVPGGTLVHWLFVRRDVERIFAYRQEKLRQLFDTPRAGVGCPGFSLPRRPSGGRTVNPCAGTRLV